MVEKFKFQIIIHCETRLIQNQSKILVLSNSVHQYAVARAGY